MSKVNVELSGPHNGTLKEEVFDLSKTERPAGIYVSQSLLVGANASVEIVLRGCTGMTGAVKIEETNSATGVPRYPFAVPLAITPLADVGVAQAGIVSTLQYLVLDFTAVSFPAVINGQEMVIRVITKH